MEKVFDRLRKLLEERGVPFESMTHEPVLTSAEAAHVRGTSLASGAKALMVKAADKIVLFVLPADRRLDRKKVWTVLGSKSFRFLDQTELLDLTGLETGAVPPFGSLFGVPTLCDQALGAHREINFNAGERTVSIKMAYDDFLVAEEPELGDFSEAPPT
jgi:Ala-tRNA(Pro) deacylase